MVKPKITFVTGAGISKPAGIPTFQDLEETGILAKEAETKMLKLFRSKKFKTAKPTAMHQLIADIAEWADVKIFTQNVDSLHEEAGISPDQIWHLHGTADNPIMFGQQAQHLKEFTKAINETDYLIIIGTRLLFLYLSIHVSSFDFANPHRTWYFCGEKECLTWIGFGAYFEDPKTYPLDLQTLLQSLKPK